MLSGLRRRLTAGVLVLLSAVIVLPFAAASPAAAIGESTFTNPIAPDTADPTIEFYDGNYYMVATTWDNRVVMRKAPTLATLGTTTPVTVYSDTNPGRNVSMWAPELQRLNGPNGWRWYLMYTMGGANGTGNQRLNVIESAGDDPMGPYSYKGHPLATTEFSIDGSYMELGGELFVVWSQFAPQPDGRQSNYISRMSDPWTAVGPANILSQPTEAWETIGMPVNEGPVPLQKDGKTWVVYSASFCTTEDYQLATLEYDGTGDPVLASSWKKSSGPVFSKANGAFGTGHNDFFDSPDGSETWNLYHANPAADGGCGRERTARAQIVTWTATGQPDFGIPQATTTPLRVPSGENAAITARVEGASWQLINRASGLCATITPAASGDGAGIVQGSCATPRSNWKLDSTGDGYLRLMNASSGKGLSPATCSTAETALQQRSFVTTGCQQWSVASGTGGYSTLTSKTTGKVLDGAAGSTGSALRLAAGSASSTGQQWMLRPSGPTAVSSVVSGKVLELPGCSTADGAVLQQQEWLGTACQRLTFTGTSTGAVEIHSGSAATKCLAVTGGSSADGASVSQGACGITGSAWNLSPRNDGTVVMRAVHSGKALDLSFCSTANGATVGQWSVQNNDCQQFRLSQGAVDTPRPLQLVSASSSRCIAGKAVLTTTVKNSDDLPADIVITSAFGKKTVQTVAPGKSATATFTTRQVNLAAGTVSSAGTGTDDSTRTIASTTSYAALSCG